MDWRGITSVIPNQQSALFKLSIRVAFWRIYGDLNAQQFIKFKG
jgi:hypothetical protein